MPTEETRAGRQLVRLGFLLTAIATITAEYTLDRPSVPGGLRVLQTLLLTAWAAGIHVFLTRRRREAIPSVGTMLATFLMLVGLWAADLGVTLSGMPTVSYEFLMVLLMRDAALAVIALSGNPVCLRISGGLTLAVMLFSSVLAEHRILYVLATVYALLGSYWLILLYWSFIQVKLLEGTDHRPPLLAIAVWGLLVGAMTILVVGPRRTIGVLGELMPTSGGTSIADASAQSGVGDGPNLAQGINNPTTSGPVDTDLFLETKDTSLYDAATDRYGEPEPPNNRRSLAVAIQNLDGQELKDEQSRQSNPTREFSVVRGGPRRDRLRPDMIGGEAYSVKGKLPLHLRFVAFDEFDGRTWREPATGIDSIDLSLGFAGWIELPERNRDLDAGTVHHEIVVGEIEAPQVPLPPRADRFRIDRIERPDFFAEGQEGILRYRADALPKQTKLETRTPTLDPDQLRRLSIPPGRTYTLPKYLRAFALDLADEHGPPPEPRELDPRLLALAQEWTSGIAPGWPQVEAIVNRLRSDYQRDDEANLAPEFEAPIAHFLLEQRRGDDYAFASAACLLLRSLGFPTRFVQGLYVDPKRNDPDSGWTPVFWPADLHTWAEVQLPTREWVVIEPTPGYDVLGSEPSLLARVGGAIGGLGRWLAQHPAVAIGLLLFTVTLVGLKNWLTGLLVMIVWRITFRGESRRRVIATVRLLEQTAALSGSRRPGSATLRDWYEQTAEELDDTSARDAVHRLVRLSDWAFYAPIGQESPGNEDVESIRDQCRRVARLCAQGPFPIPCQNARRGERERVRSPGEPSCSGLLKA